MDVERRFGLEDAVGELERLAKRLCFEKRSVARRVHVREVENGSHPVEPARDLDDVVHRSQIAHASHHFDSERHCTSLRLESLAQHAELIDDRVDRSLAFAAEQEPGVEDDELCAARGDDARATVERTDGRRELASARLEVPHEAEERCVHGERDVALTRQLAETLRKRIVHPEAALEIDFARVVTASEQDLDCLLG